VILQVENGCFAYGKEKPILSKISVTVLKARILAVLGPNGIGKTTLLKCVMGLLPWRSGKTMIDGADIAAMPQRAIWKRLAYVPQAKGNPLSYTGEEMVVLGRSVHLGLIAQPQKEDYQKALNAMEQIGIGHLRKRICSQMSGGEFQMVLIARALVTKPDMLILDEPESSLDFKNQLIVLETMKRLAVEQQISCIFNTHFPNHALMIADDALLLNKEGRSLFGPSKEIINRGNMQEAFEVDVQISRIQTENREIASIVPIAILH
jgi:iron complex transport system ATP-binding protein